MRYSVIGIDPGTKSPAKCRLLVSDGRLYWDGLQQLADRAVVVVEMPYPRPKSSRQSLITLGFSAGVLSGVASEGGRAVIKYATPQGWRAVYGEENRKVDKTILHNRVWRDYADQLPARPASHDECDAMLIALAYVLKPEAFTLWQNKI